MTRNDLLEERLTHSVIGAFYDVYNELRYGFLESVYANALELELRWRGHRVAREVWVEVVYKGVPIGKQRLDMLVDDRLAVEIKSTQDLARSSLRQIHSYLSATRIEVGLLLHFGPDPAFYRLIATNDGTRSRRGSVSRGPRRSHHDPQ
jgi:GxxExxY protein